MSWEAKTLRQYEAVRRSGVTNMFDMSTVQVVAYKCGFHSLVTAIEDASSGEYVELGTQAAEWYSQNDDFEELREVPDEIEITETLSSGL